jgi:hypothetical protein
VTLIGLVLVIALLSGCNPKEGSPPTATQPVTIILSEEAYSETISSPLETSIYPVKSGTSTVTVTVYFTDTIRYAKAGPPFEVGVNREVKADSNLPEAVLLEFFKGPTAEERALGYEAITDGFTGFSGLDITDGIARVYLNGVCFSNGATYTIAQPLMKNLLQFEQVQYIKIFDQNGQTWEPDGPSNSIPACLEP